MREMTLATEATEREAREGAEDATRSKEAAEAKCVGLEQELVLVKRRLEEETATRAANEGAHRETPLDAQRHLATTREHAAALEDECGNLTAQIEAFAVVNARVCRSREQRAESRGRAGGEDLQPPGADRNFGVLHARRARGARCRRDRAQGAPAERVGELASVIAERDETRLALRETLAKCASAMARRSARRPRGAARAAVESLEQGKRLLQETMAGQLEAVRGAARQAARAERRARGGGAAARRRRRSACAEMVQTEGIGKPGKAGVGIIGSGVANTCTMFLRLWTLNTHPKTQARATLYANS